MQGLQRKAASFFTNLVKKENRLIAKVPLQIQIPQRYEQINIATVGAETRIYGLFAIIDPATKEYGVFNFMGIASIAPDATSTIKINDEGYYVFDFDAGSTVIENTAILKQDSLFYTIVNEFIFHGNVPWYVNYEDLAKVFDTAKRYADNNGGLNYEINELLASMISRIKNDRATYYRLSAKPKEKDPDYIALTSIFYAVKNTVNKLAGSYFSDGLVSALVDPSDQTERIETLLRS